MCYCIPAKMEPSNTIEGLVDLDFELLNVFFNEAAFKHGVSEDDMRKALGSYLIDIVKTDDESKFLLIGFDTSGNLIELMYNMIDEHNINVFHAMKCRKEYLKYLRGR